MKKILLVVLAAMLLMALVSVASADGYTIRIYSNSNSPERTTWLVEAAKQAGFDISIDDNSVISGDSKAVQAANENKDGDLIFGLNEVRWSQLVKGQYENLKVLDWTPTWADKVGDYKFDGKAYGLVIQNILMLYRNDEFGTNGQELHFDHWADIVDCGYTWYRQGKVGGTTNMNINNAMLYAFTDPESPAGGISVEGWKKLWAYCAGGVFTNDNYGLDPLIRGDVQVSTFYSSSLYGNIDKAVFAGTYEHPLIGTDEPENWNLVDIADGTYYIAEYIGVLDREGRTEEETEIVKAFCEWFGSAETQIAWSEEFDSYPCNEDAVAELYDEVPPIYTLKNCSLTTVPGTDMTYAEYVGVHNGEWTNIMTNLGFYWADNTNPPAEPDWDNIDWAVMTGN
ncbi:MAG: extracellular solute-binding protein [Clostridia bacterium]|nr:extracellular solute-binding protein [Clostridia bacterium]MBR4458903.1 extracellular solute-binding protein [Clostridia bacterium]